MWQRVWVLQHRWCQAHTPSVGLPDPSVGWHLYHCPTQALIQAPPPLVPRSGPWGRLQPSCVFVYLAELIISNRSQLWPGQHGLAPFGFAVVVFSSLRVLTKMTVIVISCTNCLLLIRAMVSMGSAADADPAKPSTGQRLDTEPGAFQRAPAQPGIAGKGQEGKIPPGLLPKNTSRACFARRGAARATLGAAPPCRALRCSARCLCAQQLQEPTRAPVQARGGQLPQECAFPCLVLPVSPEGAAGKEADASWHSRSDFIPVAAVYAAVC